MNKFLSRAKKKERGSEVIKSQSQHNFESPKIAKLSKKSKLEFQFWENQNDDQ